MPVSRNRKRPRPAARRRPADQAAARDALDRALERAEAVLAIAQLAQAAVKLPWDSPVAQMARAEADARMAALQARIAAEDGR